MPALPEALVDHAVVRRRMFEGRGPASRCRRNAAARPGYIGRHRTLRNRVRNTPITPPPATTSTTSANVTASQTRCCRWCTSLWPPGVTVTRRVKDQRPQPTTARNRLGAGRTARAEGALRSGTERTGGDQDGRGRRTTPSSFSPVRRETDRGGGAGRAGRQGPTGVGGSCGQRARRTYAIDQTESSDTQPMGVITPSYNRGRHQDACTTDDLVGLAVVRTTGQSGLQRLRRRRR